MKYNFGVRPAETRVTQGSYQPFKERVEQGWTVEREQRHNAALREANKALGPYAGEIEANRAGFHQGLVHGLAYGLLGSLVLYVAVHLPG